MAPQWRPRVALATTCDACGRMYVSVCVCVHDQVVFDQRVFCDPWNFTPSCFQHIIRLDCYCSCGRYLSLSVYAENSFLYWFFVIVSNYDCWFTIKRLQSLCASQHSIEASNLHSIYKAIIIIITSIDLWHLDLSIYRSLALSFTNYESTMIF